MYHSPSVLESMRRSSVASRRDASESVLRRTTVLMRNVTVSDVYGNMHHRPVMPS